MVVQVGRKLTCNAPLREVTYSMKDTREPGDILSSSTRFPPVSAQALQP